MKIDPKTNLLLNDQGEPSSYEGEAEKVRKQNLAVFLKKSQRQQEEELAAMEVAINGPDATPRRKTQMVMNKQGQRFDVRSDEINEMVRLGVLTPIETSEQREARLKREATAEVIEKAKEAKWNIQAGYGYSL